MSLEVQYITKQNKKTDICYTDLPQQ